MALTVKSTFSKHLIALQLDVSSIDDHRIVHNSQLFAYHPTLCTHTSRNTTHDHYDQFKSTPHGETIDNACTLSPRDQTRTVRRWLRRVPVKSNTKKGTPRRHGCSTTFWTLHRESVVCQFEAAAQMRGWCSRTLMFNDALQMRRASVQTHFCSKSLR